MSPKSPANRTPRDPEALEAMDIAFERAMTKLGFEDQPNEVIEGIAERIMALGRQGERDPDRLCEYGLASTLN